MKRLKSDGIILDRLSELPDSLILEILSLLEMRDVVKTALVSKRWKDLWVTIPCLKFKDYGRDLVKVCNFVYRALTLWRGKHLREFSVDFSNDSLFLDVALWVPFATERKVEDLCIVFYCQDLLTPPQCLYECSSLRKLSLYMVVINLHIRGNVKWDRLNALKLDACYFSEDVMNQIISSSPQLETLTIINCDQAEFQSLSIRSSSLKELRIACFRDDQYVLAIWAPNLQVLTCSGTAHVKCLLTDVSSLIEARLDFNPNSLFAAVKEALRLILPVIQHVVTVHLSSSCLQVLSVINRNYSFSPLLNVKLLTIDCSSIELGIVGLLQTFPKLKMLVVNWRFVGEQFKVDSKNYAESEANTLKSNLLQLRTLVITWYTYTASFFGFIEFLLEHAAMIEKIVIRYEREVNSKEMFEATKKLMSLQRSFPSVELILC